MGLAIVLERHTSVSRNEVVEQVGVLDGAWPIHSWVLNYLDVENGVDTELEIKDIKELRNDLREALTTERSNAYSVFPPKMSYDTDDQSDVEGYWAHLSRTESVLTNILEWETAQDKRAIETGKPRLHTYYVYRPWW